MTREEYDVALHQAYVLAGMAALVPTGTMLAAIDRAAAFGPLLDPTLWNEKHKAMAEDKRALEALHALAELGRDLQARAAAEKAA